MSNKYLYKYKLVGKADRILYLRDSLSDLTSRYDPVGSYFEATEQGEKFLGIISVTASLYCRDGSRNIMESSKIMQNLLLSGKWMFYL